MQHPAELQLQSYLDDELAEPARQYVQAHVARCPLCQRTLREWESLSAALHEAVPRTEDFTSEGEFWAQLASKLSPTRPAAWPLVPYLPPLVLGLIGKCVEVLVSIMVIGYALMGFGLIPSPGPWLSAQFAAAVQIPGLERSLNTFLGGSGGDKLNLLIDVWEKASLATQDTILFSGVLLFFGICLAGIMVLYLSWVLCWSRPARPSRNGGK
jgi:hypothetical protein